MSSGEILPEPYKRVGIKTAIIEQLAANFVLASRRRLWVHSLQIRSHGHAAVLHTNEVVIAKIGRNSGQHAFKAPTAQLRRMVIMSPSHGQQIDKALIDGAQRTG